MSSAGEQLQSWKEIARYLRRSVRTARRWERVEGLPVHRHVHHSRASVFAMRSEIDAWRHSRAEAPRAAEAPEASAATTSIAVLPFQNLSAEAASEYFAAGLTEEITTTLSKVRALRVTSRTSALTLRGSPKTARAIAKLLRTRYLLQGSVRRFGPRLRISAQLIDAMSDAHCWADTFEGELADVFEMQEKLARLIVAALKLHLTARDERQLTARGIGTVAAYELYLRARQEGWRWRRDAIDRAVQLLGEALRIEGDSAPLYAALGVAYLQYREAGIDLSERPLQEAERCAAQVLALEPGSSAALQLRGWIHYSRGRIQSAVRDLNAALAGEPHNADTLLLLCNCYIISGQVAAARPLLQRLASVDPLTPISVCMPAFADIMEGRFARALKPYRQMFGLDPANPLARLFYVWVLILNRRHRQALALVRSCPADLQDSLAGRVMRLLAAALTGELHGAPGRLPPAMAALAAATDMFPRFLAQGFALAGQRTAALRWLRIAVARGFINYPYLARHDPCFKRLRPDVRFQRLLQTTKRRWDSFVI
ncbi:MAG TPA: tetratricopeptide repeat protein [Steroidobacteraceae bacterium]|nr:tetratricopeptide repeat protein [Steroidobacteraceae bacterium]